MPTAASNKPSSAAAAISNFDLTAWLTKDLVSFLGVLALVMYGVTRPAYDSFYSELGMTPEDIGLNQALILFRMALNVAREAMVGVAIVGFALVINRGIKRLRTHVKSHIPSPLQYITSALGSIVLGIGLLLGQKPIDRLGAFYGFFGSALLIGVPILIIHPGKRLYSRRAAGVAILALVGIFFGSYTNAAEEAGSDFLRSGRVIGPFGFVLNIRNNYIRPIILDKDVAKLCTSKARFEYLGGTSDYSFILVRTAHGSTIKRINKGDYGLDFAQGNSLIACR